LHTQPDNRAKRGNGTEGKNEQFLMPQHKLLRHARASI
jgi:hypothetical protein